MEKLLSFYSPPQKKKRKKNESGKRFCQKMQTGTITTYHKYGKKKGKKERRQVTTREMFYINKKTS